jgi:hypothetical protein
MDPSDYKRAAFLDAEDPHRGSWNSFINHGEPEDSYAVNLEVLRAARCVACRAHLWLLLRLCAWPLW